MLKFSNFFIGVALALAMTSTDAQVVYSVFGGNSCIAGKRNISTVLDPQPQEIGTCQNHGFGATKYNSFEMISCSVRCMCFRQYASEFADANCDESRSVGAMIKVSCFDTCLQDCNGENCGDMTEPGSTKTRLQLTGSGQICANPVSEEDFVCETTGMILDEGGNWIDDFLTSSQAKKPTASTDGSGAETLHYSLVGFASTLALTIVYCGDIV